MRAAGRRADRMHYLSDSYASADRPVNQMLIKEENKKCLFNLLNKNHEMARADMVRVTGLSPTTVSALVEELMAEDLVFETGYARTLQIGRKPINLRINAAGRQIPVFSFGREGLRYTLYNLRMEEVETIFIPHDSGKYGGFAEDSANAAPDAGEDYAAIMEDVLLNRSEHYRPEIAIAVCICFPGPFLKDQSLFSLTFMRISLSVDALKALEKRLGVPFFIGNISQAMAYAEKKRLDASGKETDDLIYVNVCDGVGSGIIYKGDVLAGSGGFAGEIGHVTINYKGHRCVCGGRGCLEHYTNLNAIIERVSQVARLSPSSSLLRRMEENNGALTLEMIRDAYDSGDADIVEAVNDIALQLLSGIYSTACVTGIRQIVIGGGIERLGEGFLNRLRYLAGKDTGNLLLYGLTFEYGRLSLSDAGMGVAEYFIDKRFGLGRKGF